MAELTTLVALGTALGTVTSASAVSGKVTWGTALVAVTSGRVTSLWSWLSWLSWLWAVSGDVAGAVTVVTDLDGTLALDVTGLTTVVALLVVGSSLLGTLGL